MSRRATSLLAAASVMLGVIAPVAAQPGATPTGPTPAPTPSAPIPGADDPATGPGLGLPPASTRPVLGPAAAMTDAEKEALADVEAEYEHYIAQADRHNVRMREHLLRAYTTRTAEIEAKYADKIAKATGDKLLLTEETRALLEAFIKAHPDEPQMTPDAMFRLATVYLDIAEQEVEIRAKDDPNALADYSRSLALWQAILDRFPGYRQLASTLYLLAYYGKTADERRSLQLFLSLSCANKYTFTGPPPALPTREEAIARSERKERRDPYADCQAIPGAELELVRHAWVRGIADYQFSVPGELDDAIAAYLKVVDGGQDSPLFAEALYKLAWSYYKRDFLLDSITRFDESVKLYDAITAGGGSPNLELREESIQYIAVAFTDPWDGAVDSNPTEAFTRVQNYYQGRESEPHVRDVWVAMGYAFIELQAYDQAIDAFRKAIGAPWELDPKNPIVHQEIVNTWELKGDKLAADAAAAELAVRYAPGTAWYAANEKDREAMEAQRRIAERALYAAARNTHVAATNMRKEYDAGGKTDKQLHDDYIAYYAKAIELYTTFIEQYPDSDYVYEFSYFMGEALFYSERYFDAAEQYKWVRSHRDLSEQYFLDAAKNVIESYYAEAQRQVASGYITELKVPTADELKAQMPLTPRPIPDIYVKLQAEYDQYQTLVNDPKSAPQQGINAALISLAYLHVDDSIARLQKVMASFCGVEQAVKAKDSLLAIYEGTGQLDKFEQTNKDFIASKCGDAAAVALAQSQNRSIEFKRANKLFEDKDYLAAAVAFYKYYKTAPAGDSDLPLALYNSGIAYKLGERPKTAISLFKEFTDNKDKLFRESPFYLDAKRLLALSYQGAFDYGNALAGFLDLYETAKAAQKRGTAPPPPMPGEPARTLAQISLDALYNAAVVAELDRNFKKSIELYTKYQAEEPNRRNKDRALWAVARIYKSSGDVSNMVDTLDEWRKTYGGDSGNDDDYVQSFYDTAKLWAKKGRNSNADAAGVECVAAWKKKGSPKNTAGAKMAGEYALLFAERQFATFEAFRITRVAKKEAEAVADKKVLSDKTIAIQDVYRQLEDFGVLELSMAFKVRYGDAAALYAEKLVGMPTPKYILDLDAKNPEAGIIGIYESKLGENFKKYVDAAREQWEDVVKAAKAGGISNRWSQLALENLNREFPDEFSVLHQELFSGTEAP